MTKKTKKSKLLGEGDTSSSSCSFTNNTGVVKRPPIAKTKNFPKAPKQRTPAQMLAFFKSHVVPLKSSSTGISSQHHTNHPDSVRCRRCGRVFHVQGGLCSEQGADGTMELQMHLQHIHSIYVNAKDYPSEWWIR